MNTATTKPTIPPELQISIKESLGLVSNEEEVLQKTETRLPKKRSRRIKLRPEWVVREVNPKDLPAYASLHREADRLRQISSLLALSLKKRRGPLNRAHNSRVSIDRLPDHILRSVLLDASITKGIDHALKLMQVCFRWAQILRSTPSLWKVISTSRLENDMIHSAIIRSRPLPIQIDQFPCPSNAATSLVKKHMPRIYFMRLIAFSDTTQLDASQMEVLWKLKVMKPLDLNGGTATVETTKPPPNLHILDLYRCQVPRWSSHLGRNLRKLNIENTRLDQNVRSFLDSLAECQLLEHLTVTESRLSSDVNDLLPEERWILPALIHVYFKDIGCAFASLLNHAHAPKCVYRTFHGDLISGWTAVSLVKEDSMGGTAWMSFLKTKNDYWDILEEGGRIQINVWSSDDLSTDFHVSFIVSSEKQNVGATALWVANNLASQKQSEKQEIMFSSIGYHQDVWPFISILQLLPRTTDITIENCSKYLVSSFFQYLSACANMSDELPPPESCIYPFPNLKALHVMESTRLEYIALLAMLLYRFRECLGPPPRKLLTLDLWCIGDAWPQTWKSAIDAEIPETRVAWKDPYDDEE